MAKITEQLIRSLEPTDKRQMIMDDKQSGFGVRMNPTGYMTYIFRYRIHGRQRIFKLSPVTAFTAAQAREQARRLAGDVANGIDPAAVRNEQRDMPLFREYAKQYLEITEKRSIKNDQQKIDNVLNPAWGSRRINAIRESDVRKLLKSVKDTGRTPATVNRYRSLVSVLFNRAISDGFCTVNPVKGIKPLPENNERDRWLTDAQLKRVCTALEDEPINAKNAILMCLLTGRRRGDVFAMTWDDIDYENAFWRIPRAKDGRTHRVPLPPDTLDIIDEQRSRRIAFNQYVFPGHYGTGHLKSVQKNWGRVAKKAGLTDFRLHDLRHNAEFRIIPSSKQKQGEPRHLMYIELGIIRDYSGRPIADRQAGNVPLASLRASLSPRPFL